ncbi:MAG: GNAT family N-acetyltransferase [Pseudomonadota bacterium]
MIVRPATKADTGAMAEILNALIDAGGTTALQTRVTAADLEAWMVKHAGRNAWHVAVDADGQVLGFQLAEPHDDLPGDAIDIASFARIGAGGKGVGAALFAATSAACRAMGYRWINASIRSDNRSGLTYYGRMGFVDWDVDPDARLSDGTLTGKTHKRFDL